MHLDTRQGPSRPTLTAALEARPPANSGDENNSGAQSGGGTTS